MLVDDPLTFWDERHAALGAWRSGGDRGLSDEENYEFFAVRLGRMIEIIRRHIGRERGLRILDAGCGRGHFTDGLRKCGHRVVGVDPSPTAVAAAREAYGGTFVESSMSGFRGAELFDVIISVDVLFHILDDGEWRASLDNLGRVAAAESLLLVTDVFPETRYAPRPYIVHRTARTYDDALADQDFQLVERVPYRFGSNPIQFAAYRRAA